MTDKSVFAKRLRDLIEYEGRKASWLADKCGVSRLTVYGWLSGDKGYPRDLALIPVIAKVLGTNAPYLMGWINYPGPDPYSDKCFGPRYSNSNAHISELVND